MKKQLRSDVLKIIAMVFMLIDHIGSIIVERIYFNTSDYDAAMRLYHLDVVLRSIGRIAFPIFCYQLVMGFDYTKNRVAYVRNLFIFALISEIPFDLMGKGVFFDFSHQNTIFTLLIGAILISIFERYHNPAIMVSATVALSAFAYFCHTDYGAKGILLIAIIYFFKNNKVLLVELGPALFMLVIFVVTLLTEKNMHATVKYCEFECYAILAFFLMYLDNGERRFGKWFKRLGYWFYPAHMLVIYFVSLAIS